MKHYMRHYIKLRNREYSMKDYFSSENNIIRRNMYNKDFGEKG